MIKRWIDVLSKEWIFHNSHDSFFRRPFGAVPCKTTIVLQLEISFPDPVDSVFLRLWKSDTGEEKVEMFLSENHRGRKVFCTEITALSKPGWIWYYFIISLGNRTYYYGNNEKKLGGKGRIWENNDPPGYQITVFSKETPLPPQWFREAIIYQIFVDRFYNSQETMVVKKDCYIHAQWDDQPVYMVHPYTGEYIFDFFGGNLAGVIQKISYLKELGINTIYFNPIFESPSNHKYDTGNYKKIDSMYGNNEIFAQLCKQAEEKGINIILDGVFSHTGSDSIYFNRYGNYSEVGAFQSKDSPYYPWYQFLEYPHKYKCWWGVETLPNVNELESSYLNYIIYDEDSVLRYWMKKGVKGWRLDVADELPGEFIKQFRRVMKETEPASVLIGEVWEDASNKISYGEMCEYLLGEELDSVTNYPFRNIMLDFFLGRKDAEESNLFLLSLFENYPKQHFFTTMNLIGSHDVPRILTLLGEAPDEECLTQAGRASYKLSPEQKKLAIDRLKLMSLWQMTFPGIPTIYYGDEAGLEGYTDPLNRGTFPWGKENREILDWYKQIINLRNRWDILKTGEWAPVYARGDIYAFARWIEESRDVFCQKKRNGLAVVLLNRNLVQAVNFIVDIGKWYRGRMIDVLENNKTITCKDGVLEITLEPLQGRLLVNDGYDDK
jgi:cyclomaltodextrinase